MALNFPTDTTNPYIDASSGIKYIYNTAVGAWEAAIQPPAIVANTTPALAIEGFMWWDADDELLYIYQGGEWKLAAGDTGNVARINVGSTPPALPSVGDFWWDVNSGVLYLYYTDADGGNFWTPASPAVSGGSGGGVTAAATAPPEAAEGDLWLNTLTNVLSVYASNVWVPTQPPSQGVESVTATAPLSVTGTTEDPVINISGSTTSDTGVIRLATQAQVNQGTSANTAVTPATLFTNLTNGVNLPVASDTTAGIVELSTNAEAITGTDNTRAVTPAGVTAAIEAIGDGVPTGTIITFAGATAPADYLACDGSAVSRTTYADLFAVCGVLYGPGDSSTTFNLPDLRGEFVRGWDNGRGVDSGRSLGTTQNSANKDHNHVLTDPGHTHDVLGQDINIVSSGSTMVPLTYESQKSELTDTESQTTGITIANQGESEARPRNIALLYCIKY